MAGRDTDPRIVGALPPGEVFAALGSRPAGLSSAEAAARLARAGPNAIRENAGKPLVLRFLGQFTHLMAFLLWAGGLVGFLARMPQLGIAIWSVNLVNGVFSFWQEYRAEKAAEALRRLLPAHARVRRDGQDRVVPAEGVVPGDMLLLAEGDLVPADARLVREEELRVDQSTLTGESRPSRKTADPGAQDGRSAAEQTGLVFAGTSVASGRGTAVVYATGMETEFGKIARLAQGIGDDRSPLQKEMGRATRVVTATAVGAGVVFFGIAVLGAGMTPSESFLFALGMIVAFVPEGMLPTVSLSLAMGAQRMARRKVLVKRLSAVETLGCTSVICTDKTGTLTCNEMTVRVIRTADRRFEVTGAGYAPEGGILDGGRPVAAPAEGDLRDLLVAAALCTNARLVPPERPAGRWAVVGDPTEAALRVAAEKGGVDVFAESVRFPRLREIPFDSGRKRMTTIHGAPGRIRACLKGAPGEVLALCSRYRTEGRDAPLTAAARDAIAAANDECAREGLRVLAVATRDIPGEDAPADAGAVERDFVFLGLTALMDPPRPEVAGAVAKCHRAGIRIVMITGDYGLTAESVARRIGIVRTDAPRVLSGADIDAMDDAALADALRGEAVLARVTPEQKLRVVSVLRDMGHVVAVTGDGVNDAPALKKADIGIAMGASGTDVAREAADIVLTDDNFASIVLAVEEGRAVYANIKKFLAYIFTSNMPEAVPFVLFAMSGGRIPPALNVMQILSIDLGTDIVPALALGAEPPEPGVMDKPPRKPSEHAITASLLLRAYAFLGLIQSVAAMAAFYFLYWTSGYRGLWADLPSAGPLYASATAMTLAAVVVTQVGNLFAQRTERTSVFRVGLFSNRFVWAGIATQAVILLAIVYVPVLQGVFGTSAFPPGHWLFLLAWMPALLVADEARKALLRARERRPSAPSRK